MSTSFDGLRAILGNQAAAVPAVDVPAVETAAADSSSAAHVGAVSEHPLDSEAAIQPAEKIDDPKPRELAELPGLSDLDRGLAKVHTAPVRLEEHEALDALDTGLGTTGADGPSGIGALGGCASSRNAPLLNDAGSLEIDEDIFAGAAPRTTPQAKSVAGATKRPVAGWHEDSGGRVGVWAVVAVMVFGLVLGGTAAAAVFHSDVAHILAALG